MLDLADAVLCRCRLENNRGRRDRIGEEPARRHYINHVLPVSVRLSWTANLYGCVDT